MLIFFFKQKTAYEMRISDWEFRRVLFRSFSLAEVSELLRLDDGMHCEEARDIAEHKLRDICKKLADLQCIEIALGKLVAQCGSGDNAVKCPLIASLHESSESSIQSL